METNTLTNYNALNAQTYLNGPNTRSIDMLNAMTNNLCEAVNRLNKGLLCAFNAYRRLFDCEAVVWVGGVRFLAFILIIAVY